MGSTTVLEKLASLGVGKFDYQRAPKVIEEEDHFGGIEYNPKKVIQQKLQDAQKKKLSQLKNFKLNAFQLIIE